MSGWKDYEVIPLRKKYDTTLALTHLRNRIKNDSEFANKIREQLHKELEEGLSIFKEGHMDLFKVSDPLVEKIMEIVYGEELQDGE